MSRKILPPGMKISFCVGRSAPPDSTRLIVGSLFSWAIWAARNDFFSVQGLLAPPFTVGSLATIMHSTPETTPMPVTMLRADGEVRAPARQRHQLEERRALVEQQLDALAREQLAALAVALVVALTAAVDGLRLLRVEIGDLLQHRLASWLSSVGEPPPKPSSLAARSSSDLVGPAPDAEDPRVAVVHLHLSPLHVARAAVDLDGLLRGVRRGVDPEPLGVQRLDERLLAGVVPARDLAGVDPRGLDLAVQLDQLVAHGLPLDQRLAERLALLGVVDGQLEAARRCRVALHREG